MSADGGSLDLEDLARRYDAQVLREYLLEQEEMRNMRFTEESEQHRQPIPEVFDLRPRCFRRLRALLLLNFVGYWSVVVYCAYACHLHVIELGTAAALPPLDVVLLGLFTLGTQSSVEFAAVVCLTQPARASGAESGDVGLRAWDGVAWLAGLGARTAILLDAQCLPLFWRGSNLLFLLSGSVFVFAIGIFVFVVQLRLLVGLYCSNDRFSYDKPDLLFKGRELAGVTEGMRIAAETPADREDQEFMDPSRLDRPPPPGAIKVANLAQMCDLCMLHLVLVRLYVPIGCQESQEFVVSITSFARCFCQDVVQCSVKFFFLLDCDVNLLVLLSLIVSSGQAAAMCLYSSTSFMDIRSDDDSVND